MFKIPPGRRCWLQQAFLENRHSLYDSLKLIVLELYGAANLVRARHLTEMRRGRRFAQYWQRSNLRSDPIWAVVIHSLQRLPLSFRLARRNVITKRNENWAWSQVSSGLENEQGSRQIPSKRRVWFQLFFTLMYFFVLSPWKVVIVWNRSTWRFLQKIVEGTSIFK